MTTVVWSQVTGPGEREAILEKLCALYEDDSEVISLLDRDLIEFPVVVVDPCEIMKAHGRHFVRKEDVFRYAEDMAAGDQFAAPIIDTFGVPGLVVLDGKHRLSAACKNKVRMVQAIDLAGAEPVLQGGSLMGFRFRR